MKKTLIFLLITTILLITILSYNYILSSSTIKVQAMPVQIMSFENTIKTNGVVFEIAKYELYTQNTLFVDKILIQKGDLVKKGQTIALIDKVRSQNAILEKIMEFSGNIPGIDDIDLSQIDINSFLSSQTSVFENYAKKIKINDIPDGIVANADGIVEELNLNEGTFTSTTKPIAILSDRSNYILKATATEEVISKIQLGQQVTATVEAIPDTIFTGVINEISNSAKKNYTITGDEKTVIEFIVLMTLGQTGLKPGYNAKLSISSENRKDRIMVPFEAITQDNSGKEYVYLYLKGKIKKTIVQTGTELNESVEITDGLNPKDIVIILPPKGITSKNKLIVTSLKVNS